MKIISKFRDYYDGVSWYDASDDVQYLRHTRREKGDAIYSVVRGLIRQHEWCEHYNNVRVVVFCGKPYVFISHRGVWHQCWEDYLEALQARLINMRGSAKDWEIRSLRSHIHCMKLPKAKSANLWRNNRKETWSALSEALNKVDWEPFHLTYQSPALLLEDWDAVPGIKWRMDFEAERRERAKHQGHLIVNPKLRDSNFAAVVPPDQAYQEIDMFLGNVLTQRESADRVRTSEEVRASHGFGEQSFVGHQGLSKKERRKLNKKRKKRNV